MDRRQWKLEFGMRLADARIAKGLSQNELGRLLGIHANMVGHYEQGRHEPKAHILMRLCEELEVSADEILGLEVEHG